MNWKNLIIIPMVILELIALAIGWTLAMIHKPTARAWCDFFMETLPDKEWYMK